MEKLILQDACYNGIGVVKSKYKQLTKEYNDAGYQELTNERKEAYTSGKTTKLQAAQ